MVLGALASEKERGMFLKNKQPYSCPPLIRFLELKGKGSKVCLEFKAEEEIDSSFSAFKKEIESLEKSAYLLYLSWDIHPQNIEKIQEMWWLKGKIAEIISCQNTLSSSSKIWRVGAFSSHPLAPYLEKIIRNTDPLKKGKAWYLRAFQKYGNEGQLWMHFYIARSDLLPTKKLYLQYAQDLKGWQPY